ncbi:MAG TPA: dihydrofolate reductase [Patescibacteria group bacterium]|nr:dihydrofolate reductase [Patescibacteria group bacterium]
MISIIAAVGVNNELGHGNDLIWRIPNDLKRLKDLTMGHPLVMGRKTYESIGRVLPGRTNIIITRDANYKVEGGVVVSSIDEAIAKAKEVEETRLRQGFGGQSEIFIFGGAQIFEQSLPMVNRIYLTKINSAAPMADVFFPDYSEFKNVISSEKHEDDGLEYEYLTLER